MICPLGYRLSGISLGSLRADIQAGFTPADSVDSERLPQRLRYQPGKPLPQQICCIMDNVCHIRQVNWNESV